MISITEEYVDSAALNAAAIKNGRDLARKKSFPKLCRSEDGTVLFGECKGSGKEPYRCSADWLNPDSPVFRCSCPSRQFPCKHILGLLYAYTGGQTFTTEEVPADLEEKRQKAGQREEKKKETAAAAAAGEAPVKKKSTNKAAQLKKLTAQLDGIGLLEKLLRQTAGQGLASLDAKTMKLLESQAKELGNYYVPGVQAAFRELLGVLQEAGDREEVYTVVIDRLAALQTLARRARSYLEARAADPAAGPDGESLLEEWLGHAWQTAELRELGRAHKDAELMQLTFRSYTDNARGEHVDEGGWLELTSGRLYTTRNYRPFRAAQYIKEEDTLYGVVQAREMFIYPGGLNPRIRWEENSLRAAETGDYDRVLAAAQRSLREVLRQVRSEIKDPLAAKHPMVLLHAARIGQLPGGMYAVEDAAGERLPLADLPVIGHASTVLLPLLGRAQLQDCAVLLRFQHDWASGRLLAQPLSLISREGILRLVY